MPLNNVKRIVTENGEHILFDSKIVGAFFKIKRKVG